MYFWHAFLPIYDNQTKFGLHDMTLRLQRVGRQCKLCIKHANMVEYFQNY